VLLGGVSGVRLAVIASAEGALTGRERAEAWGTGFDGAGVSTALGFMAALLLITTVRVIKGLAGWGWTGPNDRGAALSKTRCTSKTNTVKPNQMRTLA
jgi:hypothetical protein